MSSFDPPERKERERLEQVLDPVQAFQKNAAPLVFKWIEWCAVLAALAYAEQKTGLWALTATRWLLFFLLWGYFINFFSEKFRWESKAELLSFKSIATKALAPCAALGMLLTSDWFAGIFVQRPL